MSLFCSPLSFSPRVSVFASLMIPPQFTWTPAGVSPVSRALRILTASPRLP